VTETIYPLTFEPVFRDYVWGGRSLETLFARRLPPGIIAESWEVSGHASSPTRVDSGSWRGETLPEVLAVLGADLVGSRSAAMLARGTFPLLIKLLDANRDLSLQVHPDDAYAAAHEHGELGKTEMWYILHARPGAELIYGLARGATRKTFHAALDAGRLETQLYRLPVALGDVVFIPAGTVHALLAGLVVAEVQENSDTTYRVYDWGRLGADGQPRPLHIEKALEVIDFSRVEPGLARPEVIAERNGLKRERLVACPHFVVERITLEKGAEFRGRCDGATFEIWGCIAGHSRVQWAGEPVTLPAVRFALLPAALGEYAVRADVRSTSLRAYLP
jgi:mannose-6-phosphate isomerase